MFRILYRFVAALARLAFRSGRSKDLKIIVLRHQVQVLRRQIDRPTLTDDDRTLLGAIAVALPRRLRHGWIVMPETSLRWHRRRIARHWTQPPRRRPGRPPTSAELRRLIVRLAKENPTWGYRRIHGELVGLGHKIAQTTVWQILRYNDIDPAGVDGAIHRAAGPEIVAHCRTLGGCATGDAKITPGFNLTARWIIHTVGPVWRGGTNHEADLLASCYRQSLARADKACATSIAFPAISTGIFGYPIDAAARIAVTTVATTPTQAAEVRFVAFDQATWDAYDTILRERPR